MKSAECKRSKRWRRLIKEKKWRAKRAKLGHGWIQAVIRTVTTLSTSQKSKMTLIM